MKEGIRWHQSVRKDKEFNMQMNPSKFFHKLKCYGFTKYNIFLLDISKHYRQYSVKKEMPILNQPKELFMKTFLINNFL